MHSTVNKNNPVFSGRVLAESRMGDAQCAIGKRTGPPHSSVGEVPFLPPRNSWFGTTRGKEEQLLLESCASAAGSGIVVDSHIWPGWSLACSCPLGKIDLKYWSTK